MRLSVCGVHGGSALSATAYKVNGADGIYIRRNVCASIAVCEQCMVKIVTFIPYHQYAEGKKRGFVVENNNSSSELDKDFYILLTFNSLRAKCSWCNENDGKEILCECCVCYRKYHDYCHIPIIVSRYTIVESSND
ncbi:uncharacterized protein LOC111031864 [Myzus persicae]|uniref:uncharacterized protein LOC111031864 n=1 Tax=Myzus persicae TaxID=13164 RepID=UPI000B93824D|nr:uncharacterized protein LOC111031864 [Myzus persicae]XP_022167678.1 uncharacterized protein LOC111031864 [Myzus persicae]XP_022167682.1 uncharacterized protein LOC111031864 [Myzus persicae]